MIIRDTVIYYLLPYGCVDQEKAYQAKLLALLTPHSQVLESTK